MLPMSGRREIVSPKPSLDTTAWPASETMESRRIILAAASSLIHLFLVGFFLVGFFWAGVFVRGFIFVISVNGLLLVGGCFARKSIF